LKARGRKQAFPALSARVSRNAATLFRSSSPKPRKYFKRLKKSFKKQTKKQPIKTINKEQSTVKGLLFVLHF